MDRGDVGAGIGEYAGSVGRHLLPAFPRALGGSEMVGIQCRRTALAGEPMESHAVARDVDRGRDRDGKLRAADSRDC